MAVGAVSDHPDVIPDSARVDHVNVADGALGVPEDDDLYTLRETNLDPAEEGLDPSSCGASGGRTQGLAVEKVHHLVYPSRELLPAGDRDDKVVLAGPHARVGGDHGHKRRRPAVQLLADRRADDLIVLNQQNAHGYPCLAAGVAAFNSLLAFEPDSDLNMFFILLQDDVRFALHKNNIDNLFGVSP